VSRSRVCTGGCSADVEDGVRPGVTGTAGYRLVAARVKIGNVGPNPYWAVPPGVMEIFDTQGHPFEATSSLERGQFPMGSSLGAQVKPVWSGSLFRSERC
jgi:hypothetical protein